MTVCTMCGNEYDEDGAWGEATDAVCSDCATGEPMPPAAAPAGPTKVCARCRARYPADYDGCPACAAAAAKAEQQRAGSEGLQALGCLMTCAGLIVLGLTIWYALS